MTLSVVSSFSSNGANRPPLITIGIPVYNSAWSLPKVLDSVLTLDYPKELLRIVFVNNDSTDRSEEIVKTFASNHQKEFESITVRECNGIISVARNVCLECSAGTDFVFFIDADVVVPSETLRKLLSDFENIEKVGISSVPYDEENARKRTGPLYNAFTRPTGSVEAAKTGTGCTLISREVVEHVGAFNEALTVHEDAEYCFRTWQSGYKVICNHTFRAYHLRQIEATRKYYSAFISSSSLTYIRMLKLGSAWHYAKFASSIVLTLVFLSFLFVSGQLEAKLAFLLGSIVFAFWSNLNKRVLDDGSSVKRAYWPLVGAILTPAVVAIVWLSIARLARAGIMGLAQGIRMSKQN